MRYIYKHPTIAELANAITISGSGGANGFAKDLADIKAKSRVGKMQKILGRYIHDLPQPPKGGGEEPSSPEAKLHVILTGSAGSLGIQLLVNLLSDPKVARITCLDRSANAMERVKDALATWSPRPSIEPPHVSFHQADYKSPDLGFPPAILSELHETTNIIIHNAGKWTLTTQSIPSKRSTSAA